MPPIMTSVVSNLSPIGMLMNEKMNADNNATQSRLNADRQAFEAEQTAKAREAEAELAQKQIDAQKELDAQQQAATKALEEQRQQFATQERTQSQEYNTQERLQTQQYETQRSLEESQRNQQREKEMIDYSRESSLKYREQEIELRKRYMEQMFGSPDGGFKEMRETMREEMRYSRDLTNRAQTLTKVRDEINNLYEYGRSQFVQSMSDLSQKGEKSYTNGSDRGNAVGSDVVATLNATKGKALGLEIGKEARYQTALREDVDRVINDSILPSFLELTDETQRAEATKIVRDLMGQLEAIGALQDNPDFTKSASGKETSQKNMELVAKTIELLMALGDQDAMEGMLQSLATQAEQGIGKGSGGSKETRTPPLIRGLSMLDDALRLVDGGNMPLFDARQDMLARLISDIKETDPAAAKIMLRQLPPGVRKEAERRMKELNTLSQRRRGYDNELDYISEQLGNIETENAINQQTLQDNMWMFQYMLGGAM